MNAYDPYRPQVQADPSPARAGMDRGCRCQTAYIERGSPWENRYIESFNARLRDELLNGESFYTLREAQFVMDVPMELTQDDSGSPEFGIKALPDSIFVAAAVSRLRSSDPDSGVDYSISLDL